MGEAAVTHPCSVSPQSPPASQEMPINDLAGEHHHDVHVVVVGMRQVPGRDVAGLGHQILIGAPGPSGMPSMYQAIKNKIQTVATITA